MKHDPEKWMPVFGKDHAQTKGWFCGRGVRLAPLICYEWANRGVGFLIRFDDRSALRLAAFIALAAALALGGCGRKGALDPPPAAVAAPALDQPSLGDNPDPNMTGGFRRAPSQTVTAQPAGPLPADRRGFILDPLLK
jgi:predicted small lipoprotein YifL